MEEIANNNPPERRLATPPWPWGMVTGFFLALFIFIGKLANKSKIKSYFSFLFKAVVVYYWLYLVHQLLLIFHSIFKLVQHL